MRAHRPRHLVVLLGALLSVRTAAAQSPSQNPREELARLGNVLEVACRKVSQPAASPILGPVGAVRGYHLAGIGAIFILPARELPSERRVIVMRSRPLPGDGAEALIVDEADRAPETAKPKEKPRSQPRAGVPRDPVDRQLQEIELEVEIFQREAERARQDAERMLEQMTQEMRGRFPELEQTPAALPMPHTSVSLPAPVPAPPWRFWFANPAGDEDRRPAEQVIAEVRRAVTQVLESQGAKLQVVRPEEFLSVAVDFMPRAFLLRPAARAERTLVVRARKKDLSERQAGRLSAEELLKRIEYSVY